LCRQVISCADGSASWGRTIWTPFLSLDVQAQGINVIGDRKKRENQKFAWVSQTHGHPQKEQTSKTGNTRVGKTHHRSPITHLTYIGADWGQKDLVVDFLGGQKRKNALWENNPKGCQGKNRKHVKTPRKQKKL